MLFLLNGFDAFSSLLGYKARSPSLDILLIPAKDENMSESSSGFCRLACHSLSDTEEASDSPVKNLMFWRLNHLISSLCDHD